MRAVTVNKADGPDAITVEDRSVRQPRPGEVRLRVAAAAVNPVDVFMWRRAVEPPFTPGMDAAGTVESVGHAGGRLTVGEPVMAVVPPWQPEGGAQAELVVVRAASVSPVPRGASVPEAATLPMNGLTALEGLRMLDLAPGSALAVTGGAGLLASYVIGLARQRGIRVIADAGPGDEALVAGFGADQIVPRGHGFTDAVRELLPGGVERRLRHRRPHPRGATGHPRRRRDRGRTRLGRWRATRPRHHRRGGQRGQRHAQHRLAAGSGRPGRSGPYPAARGRPLPARTRRRGLPPDGSRRHPRPRSHHILTLGEISYVRARLASDRRSNMRPGADQTDIRKTSDH